MKKIRSTIPFFIFFGLLVMISLPLTAHAQEEIPRSAALTNHMEITLSSLEDRTIVGDQMYLGVHVSFTRYPIAKVTAQVEQLTLNLDSCSLSTTCWKGNMNLESLPIGEKDVFITAFDTMGNSVTIKVHVILKADITPPIISNVYPADGQLISETKTSISAGIRDDGLGLSSYDFLIDDRPLEVNYMHGHVFTYIYDLKNGPHTYKIRATDKAGNQSEYSGTFYVKTSLWPEGSHITASNFTWNSLTLSWSPAEGSKSYRIYADQRLIGTVDGNVNSYHVTELNSATTYGFQVQAEFPDGGWTTDGPYEFIETPLRIDPPVISGVYPSSLEILTSDQLIISAKITDRPFGFFYGVITVKVDGQKVLNSYNRQTETMTAATLELQDGYHSLEIIATNLYGGSSEYSSSFTIQKPIWPEGSLLEAENIKRNSLTLSWPLAEGSLGYRIYSNGEAIDTVSNTTHTYEVTNLQTDTLYTFKIEAQLPNGNWTSDGPSTTIRTSSQYLERLNKLYAAFRSSDSEDKQNVSKLREEIMALDDLTDHTLLDPVWDKISAKLPATSDQAQLKSSLFHIFKAIGSFQYDPQTSGLEELRTNPLLLTMLKEFGAAGGVENISTDDLLLFLFGDGESHKGIEGTVTDILSKKSPRELIQLLGNKQKTKLILIDALNQMLVKTDEYKFSLLLNQLNITTKDLMATAQNIQQKLMYDEPAINAFIVAYARSEATAEVKITANGKKHKYTIKLFGVEIPSLALNWSKVSGDDHVIVKKYGTIEISNATASGTAVIQASLVNPYGGNTKVIFNKEVKLVNGGQ